MHCHKPLSTLLAVAVLSFLSPDNGTAQEAGELNEAQTLVFKGDHLLNVPQGRVLTYDFKSRVKDGEEVSDQVRMRVTGIGTDQGRDVTFEFLSGGNRIAFPPAIGYRGNPVILQFLERDVRDMALATGDSPGYIRNRIRKSFSEPQIREIRMRFQGSEIDAVEITVSPFVNDPRMKDLEGYGSKRYQGLFSRQVPGGLYRIHTTVPGKDGIWMEEEIKFNRMSDAG
jgi:hypothetical protein